MLPVTCLAFRGPGGPSGALQGHMQKPERCSRAPWRRRGPSGASGDLPLAQWVTVRARLPRLETGLLQVVGGAWIRDPLGAFQLQHLVICDSGQRSVLMGRH